MSANVFEGLDPETVENILRLAGQRNQQQDIARQMGRAQSMRQQGQQGMQSISPGGGRAGPANWAGAIANILAARKAYEIEEQARASLADMTAKREASLARYFAALNGAAPIKGE